MNPYREFTPEEAELLKPRSRWPLRIAIAFLVGFVAFVYYGLFEAFGRDAVYTLPGPSALLIAGIAMVRRFNDPRVEAARTIAIEQQAAARVDHPEASWPRTGVA